MKKYTDSFFAHKEASKRVAAEDVLALVINKYPNLNSVIDVGCGKGVWLAVAQKLGVRKICGVDGRWLNPETLLFPEEYFKSVDLASPFEVEGCFDLAISLEVAEHLPEDSAEGFVDQLVALSDAVLFSAAIPGQGGIHHVNEQWQSYWVEKFVARGYVVEDFIRPAIWSRTDIPSYYQQNILFFKRGANAEAAQENILDVVHPALFRRANSPSIKNSVRSLLAALKRRLIP